MATFKPGYGEVPKRSGKTRPQIKVVVNDHAYGQMSDLYKDHQDDEFVYQMKKVMVSLGRSRFDGQLPGVVVQEDEGSRIIVQDGIGVYFLPIKDDNTVVVQGVFDAGEATESLVKGYLEEGASFDGIFGRVDDKHEDTRPKFPRTQAFERRRPIGRMKSKSSKRKKQN